MNGDNDSSAEAIELASLTDDERRVLAVLVVVGGASLSDDQIASFGGVDEVESILAALDRRGLLSKDERGRHAVPAGPLDRLRRALDVVDTADQMLRQLSSIAEDRRLTLDDLDAVLGITRWASEAGRLRELVRLVEAVEQALSFTRRIEEWLELVQRAGEAARELGDRGAEAWTDEQLRACEQSIARADPARAGQADQTAVLRRSDERPLRRSFVRLGLAAVAVAAAGIAGFAVAFAVQDDDEAGSTTLTLPGQTVTAPGDTLTLPGSTVTVGGETVTLPGATVTLPGETDTLPSETVTLPDTTVPTTVFVPAVP